MKTENGKVNINTIAKLAHVSTTTVSNYINATEVFPISEETKERISKVMRELNYRPHIGGSMIRRSQNLPGKVCFIFGPQPELPVFDVIQVPLLSRLLRDLSVELRENFEMSMEVRNVKNEKSVQDWNDLLVDVEYVINYEPLNSMLFDLLQRKNIPLLELSTVGTIQQYNPNAALVEGVNPVQINDASAKADHVHWDIRKQTAMIMDYIYAQGCRKTLLVPSWNIKANRKDFYGLDSEAKVEGFTDALQKYPDLHGEVIRPEIPENLHMFYELRNTYDTLMRQPEKLRNVDAIIAHNDIVAQGVIAALKAQGIEPGKDVIVTGEGDFQEFRYAIPSIITTGCDQKKRLSEICRLIARRREEPGAEYLSIEIPSLIIKHG